MNISMLRNTLFAAGLALSAGGAFAQEAATPAAPAQPAVAPAAQPASEPAAKPLDILDRKMNDLDGKEQDLNAYRGKVVLIVNVASQCGYTYQYGGLEKLYQKYKDRGLVILGFPANDFGEQEPGGPEEIKKTCNGKYHVTFPMFAKISVVGDTQHELYKAITSAPLPAGEPPKWNFTKYLLNREGKLVTCFNTRVKPDDASLARSIEELLGPETTPAPEAPAKDEAPAQPAKEK